MLSGVTIYNDRMNLVVDDRYNNLALSHKEILRIPAATRNGPNLNRAAVKVPLRENDVLVAVELSDVPAGVFVSSAGVTAFSANDSGVTLGCYFFSSKMAGATAPNGLQVFSENGTCVFDSNRKYMRVVEFQKGYFRGYPNANPERALCRLPIGQKGRKYGVVFPCTPLHTAFNSETDSPVMCYRSTLGTRIQEGVIYISPVSVATELRALPGPRDTNIDITVPYSVMIVDLTGC